MATIKGVTDYEKGYRDGMNAFVGFEFAHREELKLGRVYNSRLLPKLLTEIANNWQNIMNGVPMTITTANGTNETVYLTPKKKGKSK